jgi:hypothetical protein
MQPNDQSFNGPIPGASLTRELGSQPDERPPMYVDPTEAYDFLVDRIANPDVFKRIAVAAELGVPSRTYGQTYCLRWLGRRLLHQRRDAPHRRSYL